MSQSGGSGLLGSFDPASPSSTWSLSSLGGVDAVACPQADLCLAADDEGNLAAGVTTRAVRAELSKALLARRHLPGIASLYRTRRDRLTVTSAIASRVSLVWTAKRSGRTVIVGTGRHRFGGSGASGLTVHLTPAGGKLLRKAHRMTVRAVATFTASTGSTQSSAKLTFTR